MRIETITSRKNPLMIHVKKLLTSRSYRVKSGQYAADGTKLLEEAVRWGAEVETVIATKGAVSFPLPENVRYVEVPEDVMKSVSLMEAPQGAIFICCLPEKKPLVLPKKCLILDGLQDTGNIGTILRTADALNLPVVLTADCADPYNPKTVRASMGAVFRSAVIPAEREEIITFCKSNGIPLYVTALSERAEDIRNAELNGAVVIGNEGNGVSKAFLEQADKELIIPMNSRCESLNAAVAAAIVIWQMNSKEI